ncbi:MAG: amidohydrolase [Clostridium sp.]|nr:amidohydrolase [Clostridium sp.]
MNVMECVQEKKEYLTGLRRWFHQYPELAFQEFKTAEHIREELDKMNIPYQTVGTGTVAVLSGTSEKPVIGLRCDEDALPITEVKESPFKSKHDGCMHACGHDAHITMLLGAARILSEHREELNCTIKFIFQPAEEVFGGAKKMLESGLLDDVDTFCGMHIFPYIPAGKISVEEGPRYTSADSMKIKIIGKSGHGAMPQFSVDPIYVGCQVVNALQSIASRETDPVETCVISVCKFHCGSLFNVIEESAELEGTVRTFSPELRKRLPEIIERVIKNTCSAFRADYEFEYTFGAPATINDAGCSQIAEKAVKKILGEDGLALYTKTPGGEDFAYMLERRPGIYAFVGCRNEAQDQCYPLHHKRFDLDEEGMLNGCAFYIQYVLDIQDKI